MKWLRFPRLMGLVVCLYLAAMAAVFGLLAGDDTHFLDSAKSVEGTVVELVQATPTGSVREPNPRRKVFAYAPKVSYTVDNLPYEYTSGQGHYNQRLRVGDKVTILYDAADPAVARIKGDGQRMLPSLAVGFAVSAVLVAALLVATRRLVIQHTVDRLEIRRRREASLDDAAAGR